MSAAGDRVAVACGRGQSLPAPAVPAVSGREDLARLRYANNLLRVARMHGDAHHRRLRLDPVIEALPGLADVITAEDPAVAAAEGRAQGGVQHIRIMRRDPQIAAVGQRENRPTSMSCQCAPRSSLRKRPMRLARNTVPGAAALQASAWPSSMPSISV